MKKLSYIRNHFRLYTETILMKYRLLPADTDWEGISPVFIISTGRSGTSFFASLFSEFSGTYAVHEPDPTFLHMCITHASDLQPVEKTARYMLYNRSALCRDAKRSGANRYIESNNRLFSLVKPLRFAFPDSRIIHIIRDGRDYVSSGMNRNWYTADDTDHRLSAVSFPDDPCHDTWDSMSRFQKICWRWQKKDGFIHDALRDDPKSITVKFEDIFNSIGNSGLYRIIDFIGLTREEAEPIIKRQIETRINSNKTESFPRWSEWDAHTMARFDDVCGRHMRLYGYYS
ncbi:MAG: sulfotransferase [Spirochaetota bacterium]